MNKQKILSGIRPTGKLHIGNYLGALKHFVELQKKYQCFFFIADLHSLNEPYNPKIKYQQILEQAAEYLAIGLDPKKCVIFIQSHLSQHSELAVILSNVIPVSYLFRMTQFKEKSEELGKSISSGLLYYPVLMAADILIYKPAHIPVGDDQTQHVELARDAARFFNNSYGKTFPEPKPLYTEAPRVMSIVDPTKKMSKSLGDAHCIYMDDEYDTIIGKLAKAPTDMGDGKSQGAQNLFSLLRSFSPPKVYHRFMEYKKNRNIRYSELKKQLAEDIYKYFYDFRKKKKEFLANEKILEKILTQGAKQAQLVAQKTLLEVKRKVGILP